VTEQTTDYPDFMAGTPQTDSAGEVFDPELHASKPDGTPATKTDGTFRKKRRDAGGRRAAAPRTSSARTKRAAGGGSSSGSKLLAEQHARHAQAVKDAAGVPLAFLAFTSPVDAHTLTDLVEPMAEALATVAPEAPWLAAALDKVGGIGGWTTVGTILLVGAVQVMHNHDRIPEEVARMVGAKPKRETVALLEQRAAAMRAARQGASADAA